MNEHGRRECGPDCDDLAARTMALVARHFGELGPAMLAVHEHDLNEHWDERKRPTCGVDVTLHEGEEGKR